MTKPVLVLVGHGMVGHHFLEQCVSRNLHQQFRIVVFGEERYAAYDRVHLSEYFAGRSAESLSLVDGDFFARHGIELRLSETIAAIDREARVVRDTSGHETHWDTPCLHSETVFFPSVCLHHLLVRMCQLLLQPASFGAFAQAVATSSKQQSRSR